MCESFFATLECELIWRRSFRTAAEARREVFGFIEGFYNTRRLNSSLGYESPLAFERNNCAAQLGDGPAPPRLRRAVASPEVGKRRKRKHHPRNSPSV